VPHHFNDLPHALVVVAVDKHQHLAIARQQRVDGSFVFKGMKMYQMTR